MALPANTFTTYTAIGNREDLSNLIANISPEETPFLTGASKGTATAKFHEWQTDALSAAASNAQLEGDDDTIGASTPTVRLGNRLQISKKTAAVTGSQLAVSTAGRPNEMAYQMSKRAAELKRDQEFILLSNQAAVTGNATTAPALRGLEGWYATNVSRGAGGSNGSTGSAATDGTQRALTEDLLKTVLQSCYTNGGNPDTIMCGPTQKQVISGFGGNANRTIDAKGKALITNIDVYSSDFGTLKVQPNRFQRARTVHILQMDMVGVDYLSGRQSFMYDLAKTGDSVKKTIGSEYTLRVNNEAAHGVIADLS